MFVSDRQRLIVAVVCFELVPASALQLKDKDRGVYYYSVCWVEDIKISLSTDWY